MKGRGSLTETVSPLRNPAFRVPSSYSRGQTLRAHKCLESDPRRPSALTDRLVADAQKQRVHFEAYRAVAARKVALLQTLSNDVCHLAGLSFRGFHTKKYTWKEHKLSKSS